MTRRVLLTVAASAVTLVSATTAGAAPGALDPGYGAGGVATINAGTEPTAATAVTTRVGGDGRLYTAALSGDGSRFVARVEARSATTGAIDAGFAAGGRDVRLRGDAQPIGLAVSAAATPTVHLGMVADDLGVPLVAMARINAAGALDPTYGGGDGIGTIAVPNLPSALLFRDGLQGFAGVAGPLVLADGRAYLVLSRINGLDATTIVVRFTAAGLPDAAFGGGDGVVELPGLAVNDLAAPADGSSLYLAGSTLTIGGTLSLVRLTAAGALDPAFAGGRVNTVVPTASSAAARGVLLTATDVTIAGQATVVGGNAVVLVRYTLAGAQVGSVVTGPPAAGKSVGGFAQAAAGGPYWVAETGSGFPAPLVIERFSSVTGLFDVGYGTKTLTLTGGVTVNDLAAIAPVPGDLIVSGAVQTVAPTGRAAFAMRVDTTGVPEAGFGTAGVVTPTRGAVRARVLATSLQQLAGGAVAIGGTATDGGLEDGLFARLTPSGLVDGGFSGGTLIVPQGTGQSYVFGLDADKNGNLAGAGRAQSGGDAVAVQRLNANGTLAAAFPPAIVATATTAQAGDVLIDGPGLIVGGTITAPGGSKLYLTRVVAGGILDGTFGTGGSTELQIGTQAGVNELIRLPNGKFVASLFTSVGGVGRMGIARFTARGLLDTTFAGGAGYALVSPPGLQASPRALALAPDGGFVMLGLVSGASVEGYGIARFTAAGAFDPTFGAGGFRVSTLPTTPTLRFAEGLAVAADGRIVFSFSDLVGNTSKAYVARLSARGVPDTSFGANGTALIPGKVFGESDAVAVVPDGRIIVTGRGQTGRELAVARLLSDRPKVTTRPADRRKKTSARASGRVTPLGGVTTWWVEYGRTKKYGKRSTKHTISGVAGIRTVRATLKKLRRNTKYHFRVVAQNGSGLTKGSDRTLRTRR